MMNNQNQKEQKNLHGRIVNGKMQYTTPRYNVLRGGNWKTGFSGIGSTGGDTIEFEIINEEMIDKIKVNNYYTFDVVDGKALITK